MPRPHQGVRNIKKELNAAFNQWKSESQPTFHLFHYRNKKTEYRQALRNFIVAKENGK